MVGRWFYLLAVGIGVIAYVNAPQGGASAEIRQACDAAGAVSVAIAWPAQAEGALETWVDLSLTDGFVEGGFTSHGPFEPARVEYIMAGVPAGVEYHYRVNTRHADAWRTTAEGSFVSGCGGGVDGDEVGGFSAFLQRLKPSL